MGRITVYTLAILTVMSLAGCGAGDDTTTDDGAAANPPEEAATEPVETGTTDSDAGTSSASVTLASASSDLGTILVDGDGMTLYVFDNDSGGDSSCYDACAQTWPPLIGEAKVSGEVDASLIGTTERTDGSVQVTYDGWPLYYYAADSAAGDTNGQGVGDVWWVVAPDGSKITGSAATDDEDGY